MGLLIGIDNTPSSSLFRIRKRRNFIVVLGNPTPADMAGVKLKVFRQQRGTVGGFFDNAAYTVNTDTGKFMDAEKAKAANFEFDLNFNNDYSLGFEDTNRYNFELMSMQAEFFRILKLNDTGYHYIGTTRGNNKGMYAARGATETQLTHYYALWVALARGGVAISNYVMIKAYFEYKGQSIPPRPSISDINII